jgi:hypothetical protein
LAENVFLDLEGIRYRWKNIDINTTILSTTQIEDSDLSIGIISERSIMKLTLKPKVLFFDLGNTLVTRPNTTQKFVTFPQTNILLNNIKTKGIEVGIISNGNRSDLNLLLADQNLLNKFKVIVMSGDVEVGGIEKPKAKIFNVAIAKMSDILGFDLNPMETAFITETSEHFKVYNFLYTLGLKNIIKNSCKSYI